MELHTKQPQDFGTKKGKIGYILPQDYGFGLRRSDDRIWDYLNQMNYQQKFGTILTYLSKPTDLI